MSSICAELSLEEMLADPIVRLVMQCDGVDAEQVRSVMAEARRRWRMRQDREWPLAAE